MKVTIQKKESSHSFDAEAGESILYAGLRQGLALTYECATGTCGTCRARHVSGDIDQGWPDAPGRSGLKTERGEFLMCQAHAGTDCEIRVPGALARVADDIVLPEHFTGMVTDVQSLTHDVMRFNVELDRSMRFQAGQFVILESPDVTGFRAYSMVNYAESTGLLEFVIKRLPGGRFSDWLFDNTRTGANVAVYGPLGKAIFEPELDKDILCIAGGSGVAGMMSILSHSCSDQYFSSHRGQLYFGVRTPEDIFFLPELCAFAEQYPDTLSVTIALSELTGDAPPAAQQPANVTYATGFVHEAARESDLKPDTSMAYVAGPPPMVDAALRGLVTEAGFGPAQIRYDKFG